MDWNANVAEWLQGIGSVLAIVVAYIAIRLTRKEMKRKDDDKQKQINEVIALTKQIEIQNRNLINAENAKAIRRKNDIKPILIAFLSQNSNSYHIEFSIRNDGGLATLTAFKINSSLKDQLKLEMIKGESRRLLKGQSIIFSIIPLNSTIDFANLHFNVLLYFVDNDENSYELNVLFDRLKISLLHLFDITNINIS